MNTKDGFVQLTDLYNSFQNFHSLILQCFLFYLHPCLMPFNYIIIIFLHFTFFVVKVCYMWAFWELTVFYGLLLLYNGALRASTEIFTPNLFYIANSEYTYFSYQICHNVYSLSISKFTSIILCNYILLCQKSVCRQKMLGAAKRGTSNFKRIKKFLIERSSIILCCYNTVQFKIIYTR